jgi:hypothetical protein
MTPSAWRQTFEGRSPREHRAQVGWQHAASATDSSADESPEVERTGTTRRVGSLCSQRKDARRREPATNGERAATAVARAIRPNHAPGTKPEPGPPGDGREPGVRLKSTVDAAQLLTRGKLRRVERHWERSKRNDSEPRRASRPTLRGHATRAAGWWTDATRKPLRSATGQHPNASPTPPPRRTEWSGLAARLDRPETWRTP